MVRFLGRALLAVLLLGSAPVPAHAQFFEIMDWLERLSGPTLPGMWGDVPLVCWSVDEGPGASLARHQAKLSTPAWRSSYPTKDLGGSRAAQPNGRFAPVKESTHRCSPVVYGMSGGNLEAVFNRSIVAAVRVGVAGAKKPWPFNGKNDLTYGSGVSDEQKEILVFAFGPSINWSVHPKLDLMWAFELNHFSGPQFESFWRPSVDAIDLAFRPFARQDSRSLLDVLQVTLRAKKYLGNFSAEDFGAATGTYLSERESVLSLGVSFDITRMIWRR